MLADSTAEQLIGNIDGLVLGRIWERDKGGLQISQEVSHRWVLDQEGAGQELGGWRGRHRGRKSSPLLSAAVYSLAQPKGVLALPRVLIASL